MPSFQAKSSALGRVVHVGSMKRADKGVRGNSLEGDGVSFSLHPQDWVKIARLGGQDWWEADISHMTLLNGHDFVKKNKKALAQWGVEQGLCVPGSAWIVRWEDEDLGRVQMLFDTEREALYEQGEEEGRTCKKCACHLPTQELLRRMRHTGRPGRASPTLLQDLATLWAQDHGFAGMWWKDTYNPDNLSCPRGVIFPAFVKQAGFTKMQPTSMPRRKPR